VLTGLAVLLITAPVAHAQAGEPVTVSTVVGDAGSATTTTVMSAETVTAETVSVQGTLSAGSNNVPDVQISVAAEDGEVVGTATTDSNGKWSVVLEEPGTYVVTIDVDTLPDNVSLRDPERTSVTVDVSAGRPKGVLFALADSAAVSAPGRADRLFDLFAAGLRLGLIVALAAVGLTVIYAVTDLTNFMHGEILTFGAIAAWILNSASWGPVWPIVFAGIGGVVLGAGMGGALELGLWRPLRARRTGSVAAMVVSIGLALVLRNLYQLTFESSPRPYREYGSQGPISIGPIDITAKDLWAMGICTVLLVIAALLLRFTRTGTSIRAVADEPALASASGIGVNRVILLVWIFGAGLTAAAGVLYGVTNTVEWDMGFRLLLIIFAAVVLGGLGSPAGAALGAILVGVTTEMSTYWIDTDLKFAVALVALIGVLLVRPQGLLGRAQRVA